MLQQRLRSDSKVAATLLSATVGARQRVEPHAFLTSLMHLGFRLHVLSPRGRCRPITADRLLASEAEELYLRR
jgi:hypothetical protein